MHKATVYIPQEVKRVLAELAVARGVGEAELIREALRTVTSEARSPRPRLPLFKSGKPGFAEKVDDALRDLASLDPGRHEWAAVRARREPTLHPDCAAALTEIARVQRGAHKRALSGFANAHPRDEAIALAYLSGQRTMAAMPSISPCTTRR